MSKEEILEKCMPDLIEYPHYALDSFQSSVAYEAMDFFAKQQAIEFAVWVDKNGYTRIDSGLKMQWESLNDFSGKSDEQLYSLFIKSE